jgi:hypothetical protein
MRSTQLNSAKFCFAISGLILFFSFLATQSEIISQNAVSRHYAPAFTEPASESSLLIRRKFADDFLKNLLKISAQPNASPAPQNFDFNLPLVSEFSVDPIVCESVAA